MPPLLQVPVIRTFILHSGGLCDCVSFVLWLNCGSLYMSSVLVPVYNILIWDGVCFFGNGWEDISGV